MISYSTILSNNNLIYDVISNESKTEYIVELADCKCRMNSKYLVLNLMFWPMLINLNIPITKEFVYTDRIFSEDRVANYCTNIYEKVLLNYSDKLSDAAKDEFWKFHNFCYNFALIHLAEYQSSISAVDLARIITHPTVKQLSEIDYQVQIGTEYVENQLSEKGKELTAFFESRSNDNPLVHYLEPGILNKNQFAPMFLACGVRTDINDVVVKYPIRDNFTRGLQNINSYVVEHLSAKKSIYYNKMAIKNSQYFSRKQQLAILPIENIYSGNCGSSLTVPFEITESNKKNLDGKNIVLDNGSLFTLRKSNIDNFINNIVNMKSPTTCRYRDGVCHTCGGLMTMFLPRQIHVGMQGSSDFTSRVTQLILSNKHFGNTKSLVYKLPDEVVEFLTNRSAGVYWRKEAFQAMGPSLKIGVFLKDLKGSLNDIRLVNNDKIAEIQEERFSEISGITVSSELRGEFLLPMISGRHIPFFTHEMLMYIKSVYDKIEMTDTLVWIPMDEFAWNTPMFRTPVINDSMLEFVKSAQNFVQSDITGYKSISKCLKDFTNLIYHKVNVNILYLEILLKAYLITSETDYRIPEVTDINNVIFQKNAKLISNRTISGEFAFQNLLKYVTTPSTYLYPKSPGVMDKYFNI